MPPRSPSDHRPDDWYGTRYPWDCPGRPDRNPGDRRGTSTCAANCHGTRRIRAMNRRAADRIRVTWGRAVLASPAHRGRRAHHQSPSHHERPRRPRVPRRREQKDHRAMRILRAPRTRLGLPGHRESRARHGPTSRHVLPNPREVRSFCPSSSRHEGHRLPGLPSHREMRHLAGTLSRRGMPNSGGRRNQWCRALRYHAIARLAADSHSPIASHENRRYEAGRFRETQRGHEV